MWNGKYIGHGIGLRTKHFSHLLEHGPQGIDWFEVISENFFSQSGRPWAVLEKVRAEVPIVTHGVCLGIGNTDPLNEIHLEQLKQLVDRVEPAWVSDHLCWGGFGGHYAHDLLPLPYTEETIRHVVSRIHYVQEYLGRQMLFENVSSYVSFQESEMPEWEFVVEVARRSGSGILCDVNNIFVSANNHGFDVDDYLNAIPPEMVGQFHVAGHTDYGTHILDTHIGPTPDGVWEVYQKALKRFGPISTLIEWDDEIPAYEVVVKEAHKASQLEKETLGEEARSTTPGASAA